MRSWLRPRFVPGSSRPPLKRRSAITSPGSRLQPGRAQRGHLTEPEPRAQCGHHQISPLSVDLVGAIDERVDLRCGLQHRYPEPCRLGHLQTLERRRGAPQRRLPVLAGHPRPPKRRRHQPRPNLDHRIRAQPPTATAFLLGQQLVLPPPSLRPRHRSHRQTAEGMRPNMITKILPIVAQGPPFGARDSDTLNSRYRSINSVT